MLKQICLAIWLWCGCAIAWGQPMADHVPGDAMVYVGWVGSGNVRGYNQSHLKAVMDASDASVLFTQTVPALMARAQQGNPGMANAQGVYAIAGYLWKHPTALYITGVDTSRPDHPIVKLGLVCDAGGDADQLANLLRAMMASADEETRKNMEMKTDGTLVSLVIDHADGGQGMLADTANFKPTMAAVQADPAMAFYVDVHEALTTIDQMAQANSPDNFARWQKIENALSLQNIKALACTGAFDGADWVTQSFISLPKAADAVDSTTSVVDDAALKVVPRDATMCCAWEFSLGRFLDHLRAGLAADPQYQQNYDKALAIASAMLGVNVKTDLIDALGDQWEVFAAPEVGGNGMLGSVLVNHLTDAAAEQHALESLELAGNNILAGRMRGSNMKIAAKMMEYHGLTIHYVPLPLVSPAWAIVDKNLYIALYPQVVAGAAAFAASGGQSILDNQNFAQMRSAMGLSSPSSIHFVDIPATIDANYSSWLLLSHYAGVANMFGIPGPAMTLPPIAGLKKELTPAMSVANWDSTGWHQRSRSPFPGAVMLAGDPMTISPIATTALMASILLPSLNRARETANRIKCGSNMRQIGQGMLLYSNEHNGKFPDDLGTLLSSEPLSPQVFVCPSGHTSVAGLSNEAPEIQAAWVDKYSDYIYLGKGKNSSANPDTILLYEKDSDHGDGMNMLFADGHVDFESMAQAHQLIQNQLAGTK